MSGGFFRGTSAEQDARFSNKQAKLLKTQKFAPELEHLVDMTKVKMDVVKPWVANRVTELLGFEDEVLINFIYGLLDGKEVNGKEVQIQLTGFMEKNTGKFMKELWSLLLSAQKNASGVPQQFLDAKEEETRKKKEDADRIANEIQKKREKESRDLELEKSRKRDGGREARASDTSADLDSKRIVSKGLDALPEHETDERNGVRRKKGVSRSPDSRERSSLSSRSRSLSRSPIARRRSISSERGYRSRSPRRSSVTPRRRRSPRRSPSPLRRRSPYSRRRSGSHSHRRSPFPMRHRSPSPVRRRFRSPYRHRSPSPVRRRSPSPVRRRRSPSPVRRRSPSPEHRRSPSPVRRRSPPPQRRRSLSPVRRRSPSPYQRRYRRSPSTPHRRSPPLVRRRSVTPIRNRSPIGRRSPTPDRRMARSPDEWSSRSPRSQGRSSSPSPVRRRSPKHKRSLRVSPRENIRSGKKLCSPARRSAVSAGSPSRDSEERNYSHHKVPSVLSSPERSPMISDSSLHTRSPSNNRRSSSPYKSPRKKASLHRTRNVSPTPQPKPREQKARHYSPERSDKDGDTRSIRVHKSKQSHNKHSPSTERRRDTSAKLHEREYSPGRSGSHRREIPRQQHDNVGSRKKDQETRSEKSTRVVQPASTDQHSPAALSKDLRKEASYAREGQKYDEESNIHCGNAKESEGHYKLETTPHNHSGLYDSGSDESGKHKAENKERRKHGRSGRHEVASDGDYSDDSEYEERKKAKKRRKEERKLRKEEKRRRREERRRRKEERRAKKQKSKNQNSDSSDGERVARESHPSDDETESEKKKLEIELRNKALESLKAKKGISH